MKVLPGDIVSYLDHDNGMAFLKVSTVVNNQIVGKQMLVSDHDDFSDGPTKVITKDDVVAIR